MKQIPRLTWNLRYVIDSRPDFLSRSIPKYHKEDGPAYWVDGAPYWSLYGELYQ